ncbi:ribosomal protein S6 kinase alpha-2-like [Homarus americanus]|uniref:Ribosomal protein S6 kinase alpha-2-like n=1 Tax=Homarus americanus TaxID=6706 RepID=A0A8J5JHU8_HOMAM|nr:ribosomal protein S6 kinase alpha-2-like [Homarus americanus]
MDLFEHYLDESCEEKIGGGLRGKTAHYHLTLNDGRTTEVVVKRLHTGYPATAEALILQELAGAGGVPLLHGVTTKPPALVMQLCPGLTLVEALMGLNKEEKELVYSAALSAIHQFHDAGFYHRDLHGKNIIVDTSTSPVQCHIIDVGEAAKLPNDPTLNQRMRNKDLTFLNRLKYVIDQS